jgi:hypothetical protein
VAEEIVESCDAAGIHDMAQIALHHSGQQYADKLQNSAEIDIHHVLEVLPGGVENVAGPAHSCMVDQDVDLHPRELAFDGVRVGQIQHMGDCAGLLGQLSQTFRVACDRVDGESAFGESAYGGVAHAAGSAGNERSCVIAVCHGCRLT